MLDNNLAMKDHVSLLCRTVNSDLRNLNRFRSYIDLSTCANVVRSLILSIGSTMAIPYLAVYFP